MPANLTIRYRQAEQRFRQATTAVEELACLQDMLRELPKHKGTDKLQADLKQKISRARTELAKAQSAPRSGGGLKIPRQGAGRVILLGGPNSGKSRFVQAATNAEPEVADYPFTTRIPAAAMMPLKDVQVQLIDAPPITPAAMDTALQGLIRGADLALLLLDLGSDDGLDACQDVLGRLNATKTRLGRETRLDDNDIGRSYTQTFLVLHKCDVDDAELRLELFRATGNLPDLETYRVSSATGTGLDELSEAMFAALKIVRVYTKSPQEKVADFSNPFTLREGESVADLARLVHKDLAARLRTARVWGTGVHDGTTVKPDHVLRDGDVVELHG